MDPFKKDDFLCTTSTMLLENTKYRNTRHGNTDIEQYRHTFKILISLLLPNEILQLHKTQYNIN